MTYNKKIIRTSSYIEIYEYEYPIVSDFKVSNKKKKESNLEFDELSSDEKDLKLKRLARTRQRAKWNLVRLVDVNFDNRTSFLTLTTKENITNRSIFNNMFDKFVTRLNYHVLGTKKRLIKYIAVLEKQKRGAWHVHMMLFNIPFVPHSKLLKIWGHGAVRINKIHKIDDAANAGIYVAKYMEKGMSQELLESMGKKSYYSSRNLKKVEEFKVLSDDKIFKNQKVVYETSYNSKAYKNGKLINNKVRYKKLKIEN
ncbi:rolling circle replication-associated protein [Mammaliicoccus sciuri]|uniref:rolling circle replication-associated protein n=1 Tax=Mammaliicoccus sciuri TaxID=1296 RepID=UPI000D1D979C|nr:Rep protein [Mammaliicoccus sciuri]PTK03389.1 Rep protein [Mammaliicoccus sciuri]